MTTFLIGIDLDHTIINYRAIMNALAYDLNLTNEKQDFSKNQLKSLIIGQPDGQKKWMQLQGKLYSQGIKKATLMPGVKAFIRQCQNHQIPIVIVSHKTKHGHFDDTYTNLHTAAMHWLDKQGLFADSAPLLNEKNIYFCETADEKIDTISVLGCTHFIDDLPRIFTNPLFPKSIIKFLYAPDELSPCCNLYHTYNQWSDIQRKIYE